jgi:2-deoxy-D-gluconate 3-dehydrogenase
MAAHLFDLTGKVAIVTGGNGGLGLGIVRGLAGAGAHLALIGRNPQKTEAAATGLAGTALAVVADVAQPQDVARAVAQVVDRFGRVDILVNNAGITVRKPPEALTLDEWRSVLDVNLTGAFLMAQACYPHLKAAGGGSIINIGSLASNFGSSYASAYATSKGGMVQLTKSLALAWAADRIRVNAILPGWFDTEMTREARRYVDGLNEKVLARVPMGRWAEPDDLAGTAIWLASPASAFVTGVAVPVDGGYSVAP